MMEAAITDQEFALFQRLIYKIAGISLNDTKKSVVGGAVVTAVTPLRFAHVFGLLPDAGHRQLPRRSANHG